MPTNKGKKRSSKPKANDAPLPQEQVPTPAPAPADAAAPTPTPEVDAPADDPTELLPALAALPADPSVGSAPAASSTPASPTPARLGPGQVGIELLNGPDDGTIYPIATPVVAIGRDPHSQDLAAVIGHEPGTPTQVVIGDDPRVSRAHLVIEWRDGGWLATDLKSANGTIRLSDGSKIGRDATPLALDQILRLGSTNLRLVALPQHAADPSHSG